MSIVKGSELCPACGRVVWLVWLLSGPALAHDAYGDGLCIGGQYIRPDEAEAIRRIRAQGGERLRLAAHP
jgi:hypothetical protein